MEPWCQLLYRNLFGWSILEACQPVLKSQRVLFCWAAEERCQPRQGLSHKTLQCPCIFFQHRDQAIRVGDRIKQAGGALVLSFLSWSLDVGCQVNGEAAKGIEVAEKLARSMGQAGSLGNSGQLISPVILQAGKHGTTQFVFSFLLQNICSSFGNWKKPLEKVYRQVELLVERPFEIRIPLQARPFLKVW